VESRPLRDIVLNETLYEVLILVNALSNRTQWPTNLHKLCARKFIPPPTAAIHMYTRARVYRREHATRCVRGSSEFAIDA